MRVYLPLDTTEFDLTSPATHLHLPAGRALWCVTAAARAADPADEEDLEYDAMQDAVHVALTGTDADARAIIVAGDVPDDRLEDGTESDGRFGARLRTDADLRIASFHVTELDAAGAAASDTDPALLWFDALEGAAALDYSAKRSQ